MSARIRDGEAARETQNQIHGAAVNFKNHHKQMKTPLAAYAVFQSLITKIQGCAKEGRATIKTQVYEPCGFSRVIVTHGAFLYNGKDAVYRLLANLLYHEKVMKVKLAAKKPLVMKRRLASIQQCERVPHLQREPGKDRFLRLVRCVKLQHQQLPRSKPQKVLLPGQERVCEASERETALKPDTQDCIFCQAPLLINKYSDADAGKDHCQIQGNIGRLRMMSVTWSSA